MFVGNVYDLLVGLEAYRAKLLQLLYLDPVNIYTVMYIKGHGVCTKSYQRSFISSCLHSLLVSSLGLLCVYCI